MTRASVGNGCGAKCANERLPTCATRGGMRRSWVKGVAKLAKRYLIAVAAHNLGRILRKLFGIGKPKALQGEGGLAALVYLVIVDWWSLLAACARRQSSPSALAPRKAA